MNLLLEAYLDQWSTNKDGDSATREKMLALLSKAGECPTWDWARALFACKQVCHVMMDEGGVTFNEMLFSLVWI